MRKLAFIVIGTLLVSFSTVAATFVPNTVGSAVKNAMQPSSNVRVIKTSFPMVYGGQDISRVATADESLWIGQRTFVG